MGHFTKSALISQRESAAKVDSALAAVQLSNFELQQAWPGPQSPGLPEMVDEAGSFHGSGGECDFDPPLSGICASISPCPIAVGWREHQHQRSGFEIARWR